MRILPLLLSVLIGRDCLALVVNPSAVHAQLQTATLIADIEVQSLSATADPTFFAMHRAAVSVQKVWQARDAGEVRDGDTLFVEGVGGEVNGQGIFYPGLPRPHKGKRYRAHLRRKHGTTFEVVGYEAGLVPLSGERKASRNRTDGSNGEGNGAFLYWDDSFLPIPYYISLATFSGRPDYVAAVDASFKTWRDVEDIRVEFLPMGCSSGVKNENDGLNHIVLVTGSWPFSDPNVIAITRNFYIAGTTEKAGLILDSDILLNNVHHKFSTTNEVSTNDVQNILTHEVGHFLGLGHEVAPGADDNAVMHANAGLNELKKRVLKATDLAGIREAYLGSGQKLSWVATPCDVTSGGGCGAIHSAPVAGWSVLFSLTYLSLLLGIGRLAQRLFI